MIEKLERRAARIKLALLIILLFVSAQKKEIYDQAKSQEGVISDFVAVWPFTSTIAFIIILAAVYLLLELMLENAIDSSPAFRTVLMGKTNPEGAWLEAIFLKGVFYAGAWIYIEYDPDHNQYSLRGEVFSPNGAPIGRFYSVLVKYDGDKLVYSFRSDWINRLKPNVDPAYIDQTLEGLGEIDFSQSHGARYDGYTGYFDVKGEQNNYKVEASRLEMFVKELREAERHARVDQSYLGQSADYYNTLKSEFKAAMSGRSNYYTINIFPFFRVVRPSATTSIGRGILVQRYLEFRVLRNNSGY